MTLEEADIPFLEALVTRAYEELNKNCSLFGDTRQLLLWHVGWAESDWMLAINASQRVREFKVELVKKEAQVMNRYLPPLLYEMQEVRMKSLELLLKTAEEMAIPVVVEQYRRELEQARVELVKLRLKS